jgi:biotin carboxyl carrier protein
VPEPRPIGEPATASDAPSDDAAIADHAAIDRLASTLVPALIAKLGATGLGEIEVRRDGWRVRVRRPADGTTRTERRPAGAPSRTQPGHAGHGHGPVPVEGHRPARAAAAATNGASPGPHVAVGPGSTGGSGAPVIPTDGPTVATSPAVGVFTPGADTTPGRRVRAGDRLGVVNMLGVPQEVVAPVDGIVGETLVDAGDAVEYGQELVEIRFGATPVGEG